MKHMEANKHKHGHHHHKNEMEHHKMRDKHKAAHESKMHDNGNSSGEIPNAKMVKDDHQEGIARIKQRHGDMPVGQHGSMSGGWSHERHGK